MTGLLEYLYRRWLQLLEFGDLCGPDGRPSQTKLAAFTVALLVVVSVWRTDAAALTWVHVTLVLLMLVAAFGWKAVRLLLSRISISIGWGGQTSQLTQTTTISKTEHEILERRDPASGIDPSP